MACRVVGSAGEQFVRREESQLRLDLRTMCEGPVGSLPAHLPATGAPAQTLLHRIGICMALRFHTPAAAFASG